MDSILQWLDTWLPPYTEQWATAYLQVLFQSFLFAVGVPTAIYSLIVDNDIKRVFQTRRWTRRYLFATSLLYVALFIIVWFLRPDQAPSQSHLPVAPPAVTANQTQGTPPDTTTAPSQTATEDSVTLAGNPRPRPSWRNVFKRLFAAFSVTVLPFGVLIFGLRLNNQFQRQKVIERLAAELLKSLKDKESIDTIALADLGYLGEHGRAGSEKQMVLDVIDRLVETVQEKASYNLQYRGDELESLIRHIPAMLDNPDQPGDDHNYRRAVEVLANIWRWVASPRVTDDALSTREALSYLAIKSVETTSEDTALAYLEIAADCDTQMVFDMGLKAIRTQKYTLATAALTKLEAMVNNAAADNQTPEVRREARANLLGIAAQLAADGPSGTIRAATTLRLNEDLFSPSLRQALNDASDYHYDSGRFDIADRIKQLAVKSADFPNLNLDRRIPPLAPAPLIFIALSGPQADATRSPAKTTGT